MNYKFKRGYLSFMNFKLYFLDFSERIRITDPRLAANKRAHGPLHVREGRMNNRLINNTQLIIPSTVNKSESIIALITDLMSQILSTLAVIMTSVSSGGY